MRRSASLVVVVVVVAVAAANFGASNRAAARSTDESVLLALVGRARAAAHIGGVSSSEALVAVAQQQSERMRAARRIFHNTRLASEINAKDRAWVIAGENVGVGPSVEAVQRAFMESPAHRANILDRRYDALGVSVVEDVDGRVYVTQVFAQLVRRVCERYVTAEDGSRVRASYYGSTC